MNAKLLFLALLLTAPGLRAQTAPATNGLTHEEVMRRATSNSVPTASPNASTNVAARNQAMEARIAQLRAQAATNRPPAARPNRSVPPVALPPGPGAAAVPAALPAAESSLSLPPEIGDVVIRPPASP